MMSTLVVLNEANVEVELKDIVITRVEGDVHSGFVNEPFTTQDWNVANDILVMLSNTAPTKSSHKVDFEINFKDGFIYTGTYYLKHYTIQRPNLFAHVKNHLEFFAGLSKPLWMEENTYLNYISTENSEEYKRILKKYLGITGSDE